MDLSLLGLNTYETKAYAAIITHGKASAAVISKTSTVPYGRIYDVLEALGAKGLVKTLPEKTKKYAATSPEHLETLFAKQKRKLEDTEKELKQLKQLYDEQTTEPVLIAQGKANFYRMMKELPTVKGFDYSIKYTAQYYPEWVREKKANLAAGIDIKTLARADEETLPEINKWLAIGEEIRNIENDGVAISMSERGILIGLIKSNTTVVIKDAAFTKLMKELFLAKFNSAPPISLNSVGKSK